MGLSQGVLPLHATALHVCATDMYDMGGHMPGEAVAFLSDRAC